MIYFYAYGNLYFFSFQDDNHFSDISLRHDRLWTPLMSSQGIWLYKLMSWLRWFKNVILVGIGRCIYNPQMQEARYLLQRLNHCQRDNVIYVPFVLILSLVNSFERNHKLFLPRSLYKPKTIWLSFTTSVLCVIKLFRLANVNKRSDYTRSLPYLFKFVLPEKVHDLAFWCRKSWRWVAIREESGKEVRKHWESEEMNGGFRMDE